MLEAAAIGTPDTRSEGCALAHTSACEAWPVFVAPFTRATEPASPILLAAEPLRVEASGTPSGGHAYRKLATDPITRYVTRIREKRAKETAATVSVSATHAVSEPGSHGSSRRFPPPQGSGFEIIPAPGAATRRFRAKASKPVPWTMADTVLLAAWIVLMVMGVGRHLAPTCLEMPAAPGAGAGAVGGPNGVQNPRSNGRVWPDPTPADVAQLEAQVSDRSYTDDLAQALEVKGVFGVKHPRVSMHGRLMSVGEFASVGGHQLRLVACKDGVAYFRDLDVKAPEDTILRVDTRRTTRD